MLTATNTDDDNVLTGTLDCTSCKAHISITNGIVDLLLDPPLEVQNEIKGQIAQRAGDLPNEVACHQAEKYRVLDFKEFRQANLESVLTHIQLRPGMTILDLGAGDGWLLPILADYGLHYLGLDVLYHDDMTAVLPLGSFLKADLNDPPLKDSSLDLVITSASLHHAYDLSSAMRHIARLLKTGGLFLAISEPTKGLLRDNSHYGCDAHPCINEHVYWVWEYLRLARQVGLYPRTYLPGYVRQWLDARTTNGLLFGRVGSIVAFFWQFGWIRTLLDRYGYLPASLLFGIPMVMVAQKKP
jgi:ubiquinone/menaquinone biosynthesis C-methylase UbiE